MERVRASEAIGLRGAAAAGAAAWAARAGASEAPADLTAKIQALPGKPEAAQKICAELVQGGPATISWLVAMVGDEFGDPGGVKPAYALHGVAHLVSRPGAEADRAMVAGVLAREIGGKHGDDLKAFLCQQLQFCGRAAEVPALATLLGSDRLCETAALTLGAIGGPEAAAALRAALPSAAGKRRQALVNALGRLRDAASAAEIRKDAVAPEGDLRVTAWYALAQIGDADAADVLLKAAEGTPSYERNQAVDACLRLARRLGEAGRVADAERVCRQLMASRKDPAEAHERCAALACLAQTAGAKAAEDVMAAMGSTGAHVRHAAARAAVDLARAIRKEKPQEAEKLLKKAAESTKDETVRQEANLLLGTYGA